MKIFKKLSQLLFSLFLLFLFTSLTHAEETYYDGMLDPEFVNGQLKGLDYYTYTTAIQDDGKILVGGEFSKYNGIERGAVLRLNRDGSLDESFDPGLGAVGGWGVETILLQDDGKIIIVGSFTEYNGVSRNGIARLNSDGSLDTTFDTGTGFSGMVDEWGNHYGVQDAILQDDGKIIAVGSFSGYNGVTRTNIARINTDGTLDTTFDTAVGPGGSYIEIWVVKLQTDGKILIGGEFTTYQGATAKYFARLNTDGTLDTSFNVGSGANKAIYDIFIKDNGEIFIVGPFSSYNGIARNNIALLNSDGSLSDSFIPKSFIKTYSSWCATTINVQSDGKILVGGWFDGYDGTTIDGFLRLNADATLDPSFNTPIGGGDHRVSRIVILDDGKILINGFFSNYNDQNANYLAKLNTDGTIDETFNDTDEIGPNKYIYDIVTDNQNRILIAGGFTRFNGEINNRIARLNSNGTLDESFNIGAGFDGTVYDLELLPDGKILVAGYFTEFNGVVKRGLVRLNENGSLDETFNSGGAFLNSGYSLLKGIELQENGKMLIYGSFTSYNGTPAVNIARLNSDGTLDTSFDSTNGANNTIETLAVQSDGKIVIGGYFTEYGGIKRNRIARLDIDGSLDSSFNPENYLPDPELQTGGTGSCNLSLKMLANYGQWYGGYITAIVDGTDVGTFSATESTTNESLTFSQGETLEVTYTAGSYEDANSFSLYINDILVYYNEPPPPTGSIYTYTCGDDYYSATPPSGFDSNVRDLLLLEDDSILIGGNFTDYNGTKLSKIALLDSSGQIVPSFTIGEGFNTNGVVISLTRQADGKILVGGWFEEFNGQVVNHLARLNSNGTFDSSLNTSTHLNSSVLKILVEDSGKILIGGYFTKYNNTITPFITRLLNDVYPPTGTIKINQDEQYSDSREVTLNLTNSDNMSGVSEMMICNNSSFTGCTWQSYSSSKSWTLTSGQGTKTVYVKFKDAAGNVSSVYSDSIIVRTPTIIITSIGQISNIVDKDSLKYYFTSTRPVIRGVTEKQSTVTFKYGSKTYTTQADSKGVFEITIENPTLLKGSNNLEYWSTDISGNKSITKTLTLIIGSENFPEWLLEKLGLILNKEEGEEDNQEEDVVDEEIVEEDNEDQEETNTPPVVNRRKIKFTDKRGRVLAQANVEIEGNTYVTDDNGEIEIENMENRKYTAKIKTKDGKEYSMDILGVGDENGNIVIEIEDESDIDWIKILIYGGIALVVLVIGGVLVTGKRKNVS